MEITVENHEQGIKEYTLKNKQGMTVKVINVGCSITDIIVPDKNGNFSNVVLRYDNLNEYFTNDHFLGAVIAPVAGRLQNSTLSVDNKTYSYSPNENGNLLHSGTVNPYQQIWNSKVEDNRVKFQNDIGADYPGNPKIKITYSLSETNELTLQYDIEAESNTLAAPTNHSYFNLSNSKDGNTKNHIIKSNTSHYLKMNNQLIAESVEACNGLFDLSNGREFTEVFKSEDEQIKIANGGFDHYFIFEKNKPSTKIYDQESGRVMTVTTTFPGMVFYTGNNLTDSVKLKDRKSQKYAGFCVETQESPFSLTLPLNHTVNIDKGSHYQRQTVFKFEVQNENK